MIDPCTDNELRLAGQLAEILGELSQIGPNTTVRVLRWAFDRFGIHPAPYEARDRRVVAPTPPLEPAAPVPAPALLPALACPYCPKDDFTKLNGLKAHIRIRHKAEQTNQNDDTPGAS